MNPEYSNEGPSLTLDNGDNFSGVPTNVLESTTEALGSVRDGGAGGRRNSRKALGCLGSSRRSSLARLGGSFGGGRGMSDGGPPGQDLRLPQCHGTGDCDGHVGKRLGGEGKTVEKMIRRGEKESLVRDSRVQLAGVVKSVAQSQK